MSAWDRVDRRDREVGQYAKIEIAAASLCLTAVVAPWIVGFLHSANPTRGWRGLTFLPE